jgi:predicted dehydrogenase
MVIGTGAESDAWVRAMRGVEDLGVERLSGATDDDLLEGLSRAGVDAVAFTAPVADLAGAIKRAVMSHRHVLVAGPVALTSQQLLALDELARRRGRVIVFDTGILADERLAFVRKMTSGPQALWRPRYIRALRTGVQSRGTLDELAIADVAAVLSIAGGLPSAVSAVAPRVDDETGAADVAMVTLAFDAGPVARIDVSMVEPSPRQEIVVACDGRSVVLDALDARAPLQIQATASHRGPARGGQWAETVSEHPLGDTGDRMASAAALFAGAVRARDAEQTNAREIASAALVWETARASMARGGEMVALPASSSLVEARRPSLQLIQGGGHRVETSEAPVLTLVGRRSS